MTEGDVAAAPTPASGAGSQRRKPRRKRNAGKKNDSSSQPKGGKASKSGGKKSSNNNNSNSGPPPPPQIKITIRNIQNSEKFGTVRSVLEGLVSKLMESCVERKANHQYSIELDRAAVRHLITEEEKIEQRRQLLIREKAQRKEEEENLNNESKGDDGDDPGGEEDETPEIEESKEEEEAAVKQDDEITEKKEDDNKLDVILAPKPESNLPTITARPSYVVPPRKTRRRGERGGTAYVLLIGPKIELKEPAATSNVSSNELDQKDSTTEEKVEDGESGDVGAVAGSKETSDNNAAPEKVIKYHQELAKGRLLLSNTIKALIEVVTEDSKSQELAFSGCIIEHSMNGKTWKIFPNNNSRPDRREGTIEGTTDFKEWLENTANQKEELKARPKPVPGGGTSTAAATVTGGDEFEEDGQHVSSLVQHLRTKKLDAKRKKSQKKKKKEENNKSNKTKGGEAENEKKKKRNEKKNRKNNNSNNSGAANGKKTDAAAAVAAAKKAKRKKKERVKKKEKAKAAAVAAAAAGSKPPTALLKPQPSAT